MNKFFIAVAILYIGCTIAAGIGALTVTVWAYNGDGRMLSDTVTASIINTAAAVAAMGFFGGFDMIFTIWQFMRNLEAEKARDQEREEERKAREEERKSREAEGRLAREEERKEREEERKAREEERATMRAEREEIIALMRAERERTDAMTALITELREELTHRRNNGNGAGSGDATV